MSHGRYRAPTSSFKKREGMKVDVRAGRGYTPQRPLGEGLEHQSCSKIVLGELPIRELQGKMAHFEQMPPGLSEGRREVTPVGAASRLGTERYMRFKSEDSGQVNHQSTVERK